MERLKTVSFTLRNILKNPGFAATFILTLGLGIGANTAIFSVVYGVLLRPLPYPDAERIMYLRQPAEKLGVSNMNFSFVEVADYRRQAKTVDELVEFGNWTFNVLGQGDPHRATGGLVTSNFFSVLGLKPLLGVELSTWRTKMRVRSPWWFLPTNIGAGCLEAIPLPWERFSI